MTLSEKYRPTTFEEVLGQAKTVSWCLAQLGKPAAGSVVMHGPKGTGKTTLARLYAAALLCENRPASRSPCWRCSACQDFAAGNPLNCVSLNSPTLDVAAVASFVELSRSNPMGADHRVFLFDEAHGLPRKGFESLLTVLERPRRNVFIFLTTEIAKIPLTIRDRCSDHQLDLINPATAVRHLADICTQEQMQAEPEALDLIAELAGGHVRELVKLLEDATENSAVTADGVRRRFGLDFCDRLTAFLQAELDNGAGDAIAVLDAWQDTPAQKRELIHAGIVDLYRRDVLKLRS